MTSWRRLADGVLSALLAPPCAVCERILDRPLDGAVCAGCWGAIVPVTPPLCRGCGDPLPSWRVAGVHDHRCPRCRSSVRVITTARAIGSYDGALREIIHALKYQGRRSTVPRLAALMRHHGAEVLAGADLIVPVPLHPRRERERGFNQADDLARGLGLPVSRALCRVRSTPPQVELPAAQRLQNVSDAFRCSGAALAAPGVSARSIVLVDDVSTTGATLEACARVLKEAGAAEIRALTAARVVSAPR